MCVCVGSSGDCGDGGDADDGGGVWTLFLDILGKYFTTLPFILRWGSTKVPRLTLNYFMFIDVVPVAVCLLILRQDLIL